MQLPDKIYLIVAEHDGAIDDGYKKSPPIVLETYLDERCTMAWAKAMVLRLDDRYGKVKIGRLVFDLDESTIE